MKKYYKQEDFLKAIKDNKCIVIENNGLKMIDKDKNEYICLLLVYNR